MAATVGQPGLGCNLPVDRDAWVAVSVILYWRRRRLRPFIVLHALWDSEGCTARYLPISYEGPPIEIATLLRARPMTPGQPPEAV